MNIQILVAFHKPFSVSPYTCYLPIEVGAALRQNHIDDFVRDDTGENISEKNKNYCELTAAYWAWKNIEADAVGLVHYRRYFGKKSLFESKLSRIANTADYEKILSHKTAVLPCQRHYFIETGYSQYVHAHHKKDLALTRDILCEKYPEYLPAYDHWMNQTHGHRFNMFVMKKAAFNSYCEWLFSVLFELEERLDISEYDAYNQRVFGFVGERLLDCWIETNQIDYEEIPVVNLENQHWGHKILNFLKRKFVPKNAEEEKVQKPECV